MSKTLSFFMKENVAQAENIRKPISKRIKDEQGNPIEFEFKPLTQGRIEQIEKDCTFLVGPKKSRYEQLNRSKYIKQISIESTVYPDFRDKELLENWGVKSSEELIKVMLIPGEFAEMAQCVLEVNGLDDDEDLVEEAKNS